MMTPERWQQVERLYHDALERPEPERAAFLDQACADLDLRAEVRSLLEHRPRGDQLLRDAADPSGTLTAGTRLGPYEIHAFLSAGGGGDVYRAVDTRLGRAVAIKVVRELIDERFEREARAVGALNHPHVCTLYDVGPNYLVMELLEGQSLASLLKKGPIPPETATRYAAQIADALAAAHARGIVHRDLKPSNVMVTKAGVKVLDFGIATVAHGRANTAPERESTPGTLAYMAPEQLAGHACDHRTDIYALGLVLREMLTGRRRGATSDDADVPPALRRILNACVAEAPDDRWHSAVDLKRSLEWARTEITDRPTSRGNLSPLVWAAGLAAGVAVIAAVLLYRAPTPPAPPAHFVVDPPAGTRIALRMPTKALASVSPDGTHIVIVAEDPSGTRSLWLRALAAEPYRRLDQTDGASLPFWSADSQFIGFFAQGRLKRVPVAGGAVQTICDVPPGDGEGATWNADGTIVFAPPRPEAAALPVGALSRVSVATGAIETFTTLDAADGELSHSWPQFLPDGRHVLYLSRNKDPKKSRIYAQALGSSDRTVVMASQTQALYAKGRRGEPYLLYPRDRALVAQRFNLSTLATSGEPVAVAPGVSYNTLYGTTTFSVSDTGVLAYRSGIFSGGTSPIRQLAWYTRRGDRLFSVGEAGYFNQFALSPDETKVAVDRNARPDDTRFYDVWILDLITGVFSRLTKGPNYRLPVWAPDSRRIAAVAGQGNRSDATGPPTEQLVEVPLDTGEPRALVTSEGPLLLESWTQDGRTLFFSTRTMARQVSLASPTHPTSLLTWDVYRGRSRVSPDGRWIAYHSTESGRNEVYVRAYPSLDRKQQVSNGGGAQPLWSRDGKELFFITLNAKLVAVDVKAGTDFRVGESHVLFQTPIDGNPVLGQYAATTDGQRFLFMENTREGATSALEQYHVQLNWFSELEGRRSDR